jgi:hypothetical protein
MDAIVEGVGAGTVTIRQRAISARKKDHGPKYQRKKKESEGEGKQAERRAQRVCKARHPWDGCPAAGSRAKLPMYPQEPRNSGRSWHVVDIACGVPGEFQNRPIRPPG